MENKIQCYCCEKCGKHVIDLQSVQKLMSDENKYSCPLCGHIVIVRVQTGPIETVKLNLPKLKKVEQTPKLKLPVLKKV